MIIVVCLKSTKFMFFANADCASNNYEFNFSNVEKCSGIFTFSKIT